jgi:hypothetical protein
MRQAIPATAFRAVATIAATGAIVGAGDAPAFAAGSQRVCEPNGYYCNTSYGSGFRLEKVVADPGPRLKGVRGRFVIWTKQSKVFGRWKIAAKSVFDRSYKPLPDNLARGELVCLGFELAPSGKAVGRPACATAPFASSPGSDPSQDPVRRGRPSAEGTQDWGGVELPELGRVPGGGLGHTIWGNGSYIDTQAAKFYSAANICNWSIDFRYYTSADVENAPPYKTVAGPKNYTCSLTGYRRIEPKSAAGILPGRACAELYTDGMLVARQCHRITD